MGAIQRPVPVTRVDCKGVGVDRDNSAEQIGIEYHPELCARGKENGVERNLVIDLLDRVDDRSTLECDASCVVADRGVGFHGLDGHREM